MEWHIIDEDEYIDGPFAGHEAALAAVIALCRDTRQHPAVRPVQEGCYAYRPPRQAAQQHEADYWVCTKEAALDLGVPEDLFASPGAVR